MNQDETKLTARLKKVGPKFVEFELTIVDPTVTGELILPPEEFLNFLHEQSVTLLQETEDDRVLRMQLHDLLVAEAASPDHAK